MGTLFRPGAGVRNPSLPPSAFRHGLLAEDRDKTLRRSSRIDVDFEQALLSTDTITLHEGRDVNSLGNEHDPTTAPTMEDQRRDTDVTSPILAASVASPLSPASSRRLKKSQPTTPNAPQILAAKSTNTDTTPPIPISDTINTTAGGSARNCSIQNPFPRQEPPADGPPSALIPIPRLPKQHQPGEDPDDVDLKRRSLFRSPGTASSPDLATLVRKQRERNAALPSLPTTTSVADAWGTVNARQRTVSRETGKPPKSMRSKTSNFFTKVFGGNGSVREKGLEPSTSRAGLPYYNHSNHSAYTEYPSSVSPPVPALPEAYRSPHQAASSPQLPAEIKKPFPATANLATTVLATTTTAPASSDSEGEVFVDATDGTSSMVLISNPPSPAETRTPQSQFHTTPQHSPVPSPSVSTQGAPQPQVKQSLAPSPSPRGLNRSRDGRRRRSMSVGDAEQWHKVLGNTSPLPSQSNSPHLKEVSGSKTSATKDWENALSGFDAHIASLEIKDPGSINPGTGASSPRVKAAGKVRRKLVLEEISLALGQKSQSRQRKGSKPDLLPLSLPSTGVGVAPSLTLSPVLTNSPTSGTLLSPALSISSTASAPVTGGGSGTVRRGSRPGSSTRGANVTGLGVGMGGIPAQSPRVATLRGSGSSSTSGSGGGANLERRPSALTLPPSGSNATVRGRDHREPTVSLTSPSRDSLLSAKAKVQPRSAASSSEPTLLPGTNYADEGVRTVRLIPGRHSTSSPNSNRDIATDDLVSTKFLARGSHSVDEPEALELRAARIAQRIWEEDETFRARERFSEWMGQPEQLNALVLRKYIDKFEFGGLRVDMAFRRLCAKLYLRGETQVIDRILIEFSRRYFEHNVNCPLGGASNIHQVVYSLLLLNTDLHIAELSSHMTKQQFLSNTIATLERPAHLPSSSSTSNPAAPSSSSRPSTSSTPVRSVSPTPIADDVLEHGRPLTDPLATIKSKRSGSMHSWKGASGSAVHLSAPIGSPSVNVSSASIGEVGFNATPLSSLGRKHGNGPGSLSGIQFTKGWENEVESYLKDIYTDIKKQQILQPISSTGMLSPSGASLGRGLSQRRSGNDRIGNLKRGSIRGLQGLMNVQGSANNSSSSIDGRVSPSPSVATSFNDATTASSSTLFTSPGFASNLTHTIIKETHESDAKSVASDTSHSTSVSISDEELALFGAPWAKEGMLCKRQAWEMVGKKAKNNKWADVFVVIQKGQLSMFVFGGSSRGGGGGGAVGGGNWAKNANQVGECMLSHSLAHILPPPGIAKRPNCFVLTLADGAVYFFQAGTEELANEWVSTCNYWAARQSKEPLPGGVSNIEYGWSRIEDSVHVQDGEEGISEAEKALGKERDNRVNGDYSADTFSLRSQRSRLALRIGDGFSTLRGGSSPYSERIYINEWKAPMPNMHISTFDEDGQLESLQRQTEALKMELKKHDALKIPMTALYPPKSTNLAKAEDNWNKRSSYVLTETVKYELYIDSLQAAIQERLKRRSEKALEKSLDQVSQPVVKWGFKAEDTIEETEEPTTPGPTQGMFKHRREGAGEGEARN